MAGVYLDGLMADDDFEVFWKAYPAGEGRGKTGKGAARKAWAKAKVSLDVALAALDRQMPYLLREGGKWVPMPATWLNQCRFEDEPPQTVQPVSNRTLANLANREAAKRLLAGG